jgi:hypothetical protein
MPYLKGMECPKCKELEESEEYAGHHFIDDQVWVMMGHMNKYNQFTPFGWHTGCYCDQLQWLIFRVFDFVYKNKESNLEDQSKEVNMDDGEGVKFTNDKYIYDLFIAIDQKLKPEFEKHILEEERKENRRFINRIKRFFKLNK